eukprot:CAMPEP_0114311384 /NCGR_PEP_ID=MMETSP0059-20121206/19795_1 /TAXON_ID=36894 /ORGANISM="Pyramimonas parkeae, Strain CCMP726" /LENGTH=165 /DNA_ID=CAMNT_0001435553 /DNA_START=472 /DNA_END=966 /DNA_ORIENTATION=+
MADAVKSEYEYTLRLRGEAAAYRVLESKGSTGNDFATIMVNYLQKANQFFHDGHPQTGIAVLMELLKYVVPKDPSVIKCCTYQDSMNHLFSFWKRILVPQGVLRSYSSAQKHVNDLQASGVELNILSERLEQIRVKLEQRMPDIADIASDLVNKVQRLNNIETKV